MPGHLENEQLWHMLDGAAIGGLGGLVNHLREKSARDWRRTFAAMLTAAFAGMVAQLMAGWFSEDMRFQFAMAGIAGYSGVKLLDDVALRIRRLVNGGFDALEKSLEAKKEKK